MRRGVRDTVSTDSTARAARLEEPREVGTEMITAPPVLDPSSWPPAPRRVSTGAKIRVIFGRHLVQLGCVILIFTLVLSRVFVGAADFAGTFAFRGTPERHEGVVTGTAPSGFTIGGSSSRHSHTTRKGQTVYEIAFTFEREGVQYDGVCYRTGIVPDAGARTAIECPVGRPELARIPGTRGKPLPIWTAFVLIFPLLAAWILGSSLRRGMHHAAVIADGELAASLVISKRDTNTRINSRRVIAYELELPDGRTVHYRTSRLKGVRQDDVLDVMAAPAPSERAVPVELLPPSLVADEMGVITVRGGAPAALHLFLPALAVIALIVLSAI